MTRKRKYAWEDWFENNQTELRHGIDYHCSQSAMATRIRSEASRRKISISLRDYRDSFTLEVHSEIPHSDRMSIINEPTDKLDGNGRLEEEAEADHIGRDDTVPTRS